jgi:HSP20 family protein
MPSSKSQKTAENRPAEQRRMGLSPFHPRMPAPHRGLFGSLGHLRAEFERLFDELSEGLPSPWRGEGEWRWGLDVQERDDAIVVRAEAPGFEPEDFDLQVRDHQLMLCACKKEEKGEEGNGWEQHELYRSVTLPADIDADKVDAQYRNGVLTVTLPKTEQSKGRRIEVKS